MIALYLILGFQANASLTTATSIRGLAAAKSAKIAKRGSASVKNICMMQAGDIGKLKYKANTYEQAFSKVTDECFRRRNDAYIKLRKQYPDQDRQIRFAESCVNSVKCI